MWIYCEYTSEKDNRFEQSNERGEVATERMVSIPDVADDKVRLECGVDDMWEVRSCVSTGWVSTMAVLAFMDKAEGFEKGSSSSDTVGVDGDVNKAEEEEEDGGCFSSF